MSKKLDILIEELKADIDYVMDGYYSGEETDREFHKKIQAIIEEVRKEERKIVKHT